jgi:hypothetical protein
MRKSRLNLRNVAPILVCLAVACMMFSACKKDNTENDKTIDARLVGKWETEKYIVSGEEHHLPYLEIINTGGYEFTSNSFTSYVNGNSVFSYEAYTENNIIYGKDGIVGYTYSIDGNTLTAIDMDSDGVGVIAVKVTKFSWE